MLFTTINSDPWSENAQLIEQDVAAENHPQIDGAGQTIAVLDTGIDYNNPSLGGGFGAGFKVVGGHDFFDDDNDPMDTSGHGTEVAGVIAASPFDLNNHQYAGIAPGARLVALRISDTPTDPVPNNRLAKALQWVVDHRAEFGITVVNVSFGFGHFADDFADGPFASQIQALVKARVSVVASSGNQGINSGSGIEYPAADPNVISVGAVDPFDVITDYTERDKSLDILAPGNDVTTTTLNGTYAPESGTSFSAPAVAGTAALLRQLDPSISSKDTLSILRASGVDNTDGDDEFGTVTHLAFPRLDVNRAIELGLARRPSSNPVGQSGNASNLAYDAQGVLHFAWFDSATSKLEYATRNLEGKWSQVQIVDPSSNNSGQYISLALDRDGRPAIAFFDTTDADLRYATQSGSTWSVQTVDARRSTGQYPSLAFNALNQPVVAYYRKTSGDLRLAQFDGFQWKINDIDTAGDVGRSASLAIGSDGTINIAYANTTTGRLRFASMKPGGGWRYTMVDRTRGVSFISMKLDSSDRPEISYYNALSADLKFAAIRHGKWVTNIVDNQGAVGLYAQLIDPSTGDDLSILFYDRTKNSLMRAVGHLGSWAIKRLEVRAGRFVAASIRPDDSHITVCSQNNSQSSLDFAET